MFFFIIIIHFIFYSVRDYKNNWALDMDGHVELPSHAAFQVGTKHKNKTITTRIYVCVFHVPKCVFPPIVFPTFNMPACVLICVCVCFFRFSFGVCFPRMCSLYTALRSGWSRSGGVVPADDPSAAAPPGPSPPRRPSATPRSSWRSGGCPPCWSRATPASPACRGSEGRGAATQQRQNRFFLKCSPS